ncbi:MAG: dihydroorotate dehydrogenase electron transfer subunit [bacterium]|nr:dihydroorotate dehydrogenase electron transfer subunit [bacterium]
MFGLRQSFRLEAAAAFGYALGMSCTRQQSASAGAARLLEAKITRHEQVCREHYRLGLAVPRLASACPGQFLHLGRLPEDSVAPGRPFLRRAFSISALREVKGGCEVELIYRVHGAGTRWLAGQGVGQRLSVFGPLGRGFEVAADRPHAWLVAGGVGIAPVLWLAERVHQMGLTAVAFVGARTRELFPLKLTDPPENRGGGAHAVEQCVEFNRWNIPLVAATDDGTLGFHGNVGEALAAYHAGWNGANRDVAVYCCGPEAMMASVARWCMQQGIRGCVCLERAMACGTGTCQSCAVRVRDSGDPDGWRYALCCTEGPVFAATDVIWNAGG